MRARRSGGHKAATAILTALDADENLLRLPLGDDYPQPPPVGRTQRDSADRRRVTGKRTGRNGTLAPARGVAAARRLGIGLWDKRGSSRGLRGLRIDRSSETTPQPDPDNAGEGKLFCRSLTMPGGSRGHVREGGLGCGQAHPELGPTVGRGKLWKGKGLHQA